MGKKIFEKENMKNILAVRLTPLDRACKSSLSNGVDEVKIYNYALTASQVKLLYNQGSAVRFGPVTGAP